MQESYGTSSRESTPIERASRANPCPVCDKTGCALSAATIICRRTPSDRPAKGRGWIHRTPAGAAVPQTRPPRPPQPIASIEARDLAYNAILDRLTLSRRHANNLELRGLSDTEIARNLYATAEESQHRVLTVCREAAAVCDLFHVPGLFRDYEGRWTWDARLTGMFIPVRDVAGRIQGCQIRPDGGRSKYIWWSSKDRDGGASSGAPIHFARPWQARSTGEAIITEGPLKADVIADRLDCAVVAVPGVSSFRPDFGRWLRGELPELRAVFVAYDSDWHSNPQVERAMRGLFESIEDAGLEGYFADWAEMGAKGLDDLLAKNGGVA